MYVNQACGRYFTGFYELRPHHDCRTNSVALLKMASYCTVVIPVGVGLAYSLSFCCLPVPAPPPLSAKMVDDIAQIQAHLKCASASLSNGERWRASQCLRNAKRILRRYPFDELCEVRDQYNKINNWWKKCL